MRVQAGPKSFTQHVWETVGQFHSPSLDDEGLARIRRNADYAGRFRADLLALCDEVERLRRIAMESQT